MYLVLTFCTDKGPRHDVRKKTVRACLLANTHFPKRPSKQKASPYPVFAVVTTAVVVVVVVIPNTLRSKGRR